MKGSKASLRNFSKSKECLEEYSEVSLMFFNSENRKKVNNLEFMPKEKIIIAIAEVGQDIVGVQTS